MQRYDISAAGVALRGYLRLNGKTLPTERKAFANVIREPESGCDSYSPDIERQRSVLV